MKKECFTLLNVPNTVGATSAKINAGQILNIAFQATASDTTLAGTIQIQASNDPTPSSFMEKTFTPSNWVNVASASISLATGQGGRVVLVNPCAQWLRAVFTVTTPGVSGNVLVNVVAQSV